MKVKESLLAENPNAKLQVMEMDLSSLRSVESFARSFDTSHKHLNILINNAGIMGGPFRLSADGFELQFATNHLDKLKSTAKETGIEGRIVNVSSMAHRFGDSFKIGFENFSNPTKYAPYDAYSRSKLANVLHANELSRRLQEEGCNVTANSLHPGVIPTNIYRAGRLEPWEAHVKNSIPLGGEHIASTSHIQIHLFARRHKPTSQRIASTSHKQIGVSGKYFNKCNENPPSTLAGDELLAKRLWEFSEELVHTQGKPK
ncbi:hypothetical protein ACLOJK_033266 [Asimina triloba]